ncbi:MAG: DNA repair protein RecO, partial [Defluviitaleaceae bacterium]|nr:DNA repair protein RecO [Defluviitaleaceae bacterium]
MGVIKDKGLVLREWADAESNKRLVLLTENQGKISVFARGAKGAKSKLAISKLSYSELVLFDGGSFLSLSQTCPIKTFNNIPSHYEAYCTAAFFLELLDKTIMAKMQTKDAIKLILKAFNHLDCHPEKHKTIFAAFIFKFLQSEGISPFVESCYNCHEESTSFF